MVETKHRPIHDTMHKNEWVHDLGIKIDIMDKVKEEGIVYLSDLWRREEFLTKGKTVSIMKGKVNNCDCIKLKSFCKSRPNAIKIRRDVVHCS